MYPYTHAELVSIFKKHHLLTDDDIIENEEIEFLEDKVDLHELDNSIPKKESYDEILCKKFKCNPDEVFEKSIQYHKYMQKKKIVKKNVNEILKMF